MNFDLWSRARARATVERVWGLRGIGGLRIHTLRCFLAKEILYVLYKGVPLVGYCRISIFV